MYGLAPFWAGPPSNDHVKGGDPAVAVTTILPSVAAGQEVGEVTAFPLTPAPAVTVTFIGNEAHPFASFTITICIPAGRLLKVYGIAPA